MATLITELAALFANLGFGAVVIQRPRLCRLHLDTVFWASLAIASLLAGFVSLVALPAAWFFSQSDLAMVLCVAGIAFVFQGAAVVPNALLTRLMLFRSEAILQVVQILVRVATAILMAAAGFGYWSLVVAPLVSALVLLVALLLISGYVPRFRFSSQFIRANMRAGGSYFGSGFLSHLMSNIDYFIVGRRLGVDSLGYYQVAYSIPDELRNRVSGPLVKVLFPAFSLLNARDGDLLGAVNMAQRRLALIVFPLAAVILSVARDIVEVLYGEKWAPVIPLLQILAVGGAMRAMFALTLNVFFAKGRPDIGFAMGLKTSPFVVSAVFVGSVWGLQGVAWAMLLANVFFLYPAHKAMQMIGGGIGEFSSALLPGASAALITFLVFSAIDHSIAERVDRLFAYGAAIIPVSFLILAYSFGFGRVWRFLRPG